MPSLEAQIKDINYYHRIRPSIEFKLGFRGTNNHELKSGEISVFVGGEDGDLSMLTEETKFLNSSLSTSNSQTERFRVDVTERDIERIEDLRGGGDLILKIKGKFHTYDKRNDRFNTQSVTIDDRIPRSDWADVLTEFGYGDVQVIELYFPDTPAREHFEKAWEHVEDADEQFARGNWNDTLTSCRKAIEVIDNLERAEDVDELIGEQKWDRVGRIKAGMSSYFSLGPHSSEGIGHEPIKRRDAQASLLMTKAMVNYVADAIRERE